jgi:hypothetical protein
VKGKQKKAAKGEPSGSSASKLIDFRFNFLAFKTVKNGRENLPGGNQLHFIKKPMWCDAMRGEA